MNRNIQSHLRKNVYTKITWTVQKYVSIIIVYAPTEVSELNAKKELYEEENEYSRIPRYDVELIVENFSAQSGKEYMYKPTARQYTQHKSTNENGRSIVDFAIVYLQ